MTMYFGLDSPKSNFAKLNTIKNALQIPRIKKCMDKG